MAGRLEAGRQRRSVIDLTRPEFGAMFDVRAKEDRHARRAEQLFAKHRGLLQAVAYRVLGSVADAEDVVQDAWNIEVVHVVSRGNANCVPRVCERLLRYGRRAAGRCLRALTGSG